MQSGDLVRVLRRFVNTRVGTGDLGVLLEVLPRESEDPMGWRDHTKFTHRVLALGEIMLYREEDLEAVSETG